jgi:ferric-dicitrate binding protein FerR (iron transport regulator)
MKIGLFKGAIHLRVEKLPRDSTVTVVARDISVTVMGRQFSVNLTSDGTTSVCVSQGTVLVGYPYKGKRKTEHITREKVYQLIALPLKKKHYVKTG